MASGVAYVAEPLNYYRCHDQTVRSATSQRAVDRRDGPRHCRCLSAGESFAGKPSAPQRHFWAIWSQAWQTREVPLARHWNIYRAARTFYPKIGRRGANRPETAWRHPKKLLTKIVSPAKKAQARITRLRSDQADGSTSAVHLSRRIATGDRLSCSACSAGCGLIPTCRSTCCCQRRRTARRVRGNRRSFRCQPATARRPGSGGRAGRARSCLIYSNTVTNGELLERLEPLDCPVISHIHELEYWTRWETPRPGG